MCVYTRSRCDRRASIWIAIRFLLSFVWIMSSHHLQQYLIFLFASPGRAMPDSVNRRRSSARRYISENRDGVGVISVEQNCSWRCRCPSILLENRNYFMKMPHCTEYILLDVYVMSKPSRIPWGIVSEYLVSHAYSFAFVRYNQINLEIVQI